MTARKPDAADDRRHDLGCPAVAGAPDFCTCTSPRNGEDGGVGNEPRAVVPSVRASLFHDNRPSRRFYSVLHWDYSCSDARPNVVAVPREFWRFFRACERCRLTHPQWGRWILERELTPEFYAWWDAVREAQDTGVACNTDEATGPETGTGVGRTTFAHAYDVRRSARAANQQAVNNLVDDHAPTCPRCDDLLPHGATYCAECGCKVTV